MDIMLNIVVDKRPDAISNTPWKSFQTWTQESWDQELCAPTIHKSKDKMALGSLMLWLWIFIIIVLLSSSLLFRCRYHSRHRCRFAVAFAFFLFSFTFREACVHLLIHVIERFDHIHSLLPSYTKKRTEKGNQEHRYLNKKPQKKHEIMHDSHQWKGGGSLNKRSDGL